ncbi:F-box/kelch-repeat protein SKIP6-like [Andrographis paniculata]|uniref:F-box/kelch-repeat protein SKIP6-like n=1 Tax=Andrographis paniculata TaxID=175694 RepID=UPI0021E6EBC7|nr:F-box/kelch-repeat protein SKIP6-like [Andrographis paniculata]
MADPTTAGGSDPSCLQPLISNLPDDISLQVLARVPRFHYPVLSLVSKSWRSAVNSVELFRTRSRLRTTQSSLYLILRIDSSFHWYSEQNPPTAKRTLIPLPSMPQHLVGSSVLTLGPGVYVIGGSINDIPSNSLWIFDCRFNRWEKGPRMRVAREFSAAGAWDGKIYVIGGCNVDNWSRSINWAEVFDPSTGLWSAVPSEIELRDKWMHASAMIGSRFYAMADRGGVVYDVGGGEWGNVPKRLDLGWRGRATVVDNVLYCYDYLGKIRGYDVEEDVWKELRGVEKGLPKFLCSSTMVNLEGKLCVVWEGKGNGNGNGKEVDIMCAEIDVKRDIDGGLSGTILKMDVIFVAPKGASISHCLAVQF